MKSQHNTNETRCERLARAYFDVFENTLGLSRWKTTDRSEVRIDPERSREIANYYDTAPKFDGGVSVSLAYHQFILETDLQYRWIESTGLRFTHQSIDSYQAHDKPSKAMVADIENRNRLFVYSGGNHHPFLSGIEDEKGLTANDKFRAVHDVFGHGLEHNSFGPLGEERAWLSHARLFSQLAIQALTTETRGQNSWVNFGPHMFDHEGWRGNREHPRYLEPTLRPFAEQKVILLPPRYFDPFL